MYCLSRLLEQAHQGNSINGLVLQNPTRMGFSDSCPLGLGGFTHGGRGWRLKLNPALVAHGKGISNNALEFLGMAIMLWLSLIECEEMGLVNELLLILGDYTSAISWIIRSSLPESLVYSPVVLFIARKIASIVIKSQNFIVPRHLPGSLNSIADWLFFEGRERMEHGSRKPVVNPIAYDYPPNDVVSHRVLSSFSQLVLAGFRILHLPTEVILFACQATQIFELSMMQKLRQENKPMTGFGEGGAASARTLSEEKIPCLTEYQEKNPTCSYSPSLKCTGNQTLVSQDTLYENVRSQWLVVLSRRPHALWSRQCGTITAGVPSTTRKVPVNPDLVQASKIYSR